MSKNGFGRMSRISKKLFLPEFFLTIIIGLTTGNTTVIYILTIIMVLTLMSPMFVDTYESIREFSQMIKKERLRKKKEKNKNKDLVVVKEKEYKVEANQANVDEDKRDESINPEIFEGSIIRDYDEILKEKSKYISLLELLEKYKIMTDEKDLDTETPTIDFDESIDQVQNKAR